VQTTATAYNGEPPINHEAVLAKLRVKYNALSLVILIRYAWSKGLAVMQHVSEPSDFGKMILAFYLRLDQFDIETLDNIKIA